MADVNVNQAGAKPTALTNAQLERMLSRIALMASLTANALRDMATNSSPDARENMMEVAAAQIDAIGAIADSASGYKVNGGFEEWVFGSDFGELGRAPA